MTLTAHPSFDLREIPFSYRGSWLNLSPVTGLHTHTDAVHLVSHRNGMHAPLALLPERGGRSVRTDWRADPSRFTWLAADGSRVEAAFASADLIRLRGRGLDLRVQDATDGLTPFTGSYLYTEPADGAFVFTSYETGRRYRLTVIRGRAEVDGSEALGVARRAVLLGPADAGDADGDAGAGWEAALEEITTASPPFASTASFEDVAAAAGEGFTAYLDAVAPWRDGRTPAAALAAYVLWSATVGVEGFVRRESVLMSKHWMDKVWSWDHCFNALALAAGLPDAALDQFLAPFDHQDEAGALPDSVTHSEVLRNFVKPPIHGWTLRRLRGLAARDLTRPELQEIYEGLTRWTDFWLTHRRAPGHVLPYYQHGNDSGWDNATTFDTDRVVEAPDLAAFLVLQLEVLAELGEELGHPVARWKAERDDVLAVLLEQLWSPDGFTAIGALSGRRSGTSSLLTLLPIVLGERLPAAVRVELARRIEGHLTDHGPATELPSSPYYEDDGYWRGPIWAPSTALIEDGLRSAGFPDLADTVSARFRALCEHSGFAENFDAVTGQGLRDRAYTWTAAVYLTLAAAQVAREDGAAPHDGSRR